MLVFESEFSEVERHFRERAVDGFVPAKVWDFHAHLASSAHFRGPLPSFLNAGEKAGLERYQIAMEELLPGRERRALLFGMPGREVAWSEANEWLAGEIKGHAGMSGLALCPPEAEPDVVAEWLTRHSFRGIKPYHVFARRTDTQQASVEEYAPEWMWECLDARKGILMLHIVRDEAIADDDNVAALQRLCGKYPSCQVILAHIARSFCRHHAHEGLERVVGCGNIWLDTSAITEKETFVSALRVFGPGRILFGSDHPVSHFRGRCVTEGRDFRWILRNRGEGAAGFYPVGLESLQALRLAMEETGMTSEDIEAVFFGNAERLMAAG